MQLTNSVYEPSVCVCKGSGQILLTNQDMILVSYFSSVVLMKMDPNMNNAPCLYASLSSNILTTFVRINKQVVKERAYV